MYLNYKQHSFTFYLIHDNDHSTVHCSNTDTKVHVESYTCISLSIKHSQDVTVM